jgi:hypothetical protein
MQDETNSELQNSLFIVGGIAMMAFGAGLILGNPSIRRTIAAGIAPLLPNGKDAANGGLGGLLPDVERYLRLRAM